MWLNDLATAAFFEAIRTHGHKIKVPPRSRQSLKSSVTHSNVVIPLQSCSHRTLHTAAACTKAELKRFSCGDDDGGVTSTGFEKTLRECHRILHRTRAKSPGLTGHDFRRGYGCVRGCGRQRGSKSDERGIWTNVDCRIWFVR